MKYRQVSDEREVCLQWIGWTMASLSLISLLWQKELQMDFHCLLLPPEAICQSISHPVVCSGFIEVLIAYKHSYYAGSMGGTYGGNSVSCAAALAVLDVFEKEDILGNVMACEEVVRQRLHMINEATGGRIIREVRGRGLMIGE